jgi:hypothetical protein
MKQLLEANNQYKDSNVLFGSLNLSDDWTRDNNLWFNIFNCYKKFNYVIANFSIMYFFNNLFWSQLDRITESGTTFIFNVPCPNKGKNNWTFNNSYLTINEETKTTNYLFEWTHTTVKTEPYISCKEIEKTINKYNWVIKNITQSDSDNLDGFYKWYIIEKL